MASPKRSGARGPATTKRRDRVAPAPDAARAAKEAAAREFAIAAARSLHDDKCTDVVALDVRGKSQVTDFIVVASGASERQMRSASVRVADLGEASNFSLFRSNKDQTAQSWFVLDFVDVVVHVFEPSARAYYDLEMMWGDSPRMEWQRAAPAPRAPRTTVSPAAKPAARSPKKKAAVNAAPTPPRRAAATRAASRTTPSTRGATKRKPKA